MNTGLEAYANREQKEHWARTLGLEVVPLLYQGMIESADELRELFETVSILGGQKIEGVVIKPEKYDLFGRDKKCVLGKYVSERYREVHAKHYKTPKPKEETPIAARPDLCGNVSTSVGTRRRAFSQGISGFGSEK